MRSWVQGWAWVFSGSKTLRLQTPLGQRLILGSVGCLVGSVGNPVCIMPVLNRVERTLPLIGLLLRSVCSVTRGCVEM